MFDIKQLLASPGINRLLQPLMMGGGQGMQPPNMLAGAGQMQAPVPPMPVQAPAAQMQPQQQKPGLMDRYNAFTESDRGRTLNDFFLGLAMGSNPNQSLAGAAQMVATGRAERAGKKNQNQTVEWLTKQGMSPEEAQMIASQPNVLSEFLKNRILPQQDKATETMRNLEWRAQQAGLQPGTKEYADFMATGGNKGITVDARNMGSIPQGYRMIYDAQGNPVQMEPIPGGPEDKTAQNAAAEANRQTAGDTITSAAAKARKIAGEGGRMATGIGGQIAAGTGIGETSAVQLRQQVEVLKSIAKVENLTAMRAASPTGGALGAVSDRENDMLAAKAGALDPNAEPEVFMQQLDDYERTLLRIIHGPKVGDAIFEQTRGGGQKPLTEMTDQELEAIINGQ